MALLELGSVTKFGAMGLDISLARPGIAVVDEDHQVHYVAAYETKSGLTDAQKGDQEHQFRDTDLRISEILCWIMGTIDNYEPDAFYIERPFVRGSGMTSLQLAGVHFCVRQEITTWLRRRGRPPVVNSVTQQALKAYAGVNPNAAGLTSAQKKRLVLDKANERWGLKLKNKQTDEADALFLADMAVTELAPLAKPKRIFLGRPS